jgi:hypothetical protein
MRSSHSNSIKSVSTLSHQPSQTKVHSSSTDSLAFPPAHPLTHPTHPISSTHTAGRLKGAGCLGCWPRAVWSTHHLFKCPRQSFFFSSSLQNLSITWFVRHFFFITQAISCSYPCVCVCVRVCARVRVHEGTRMCLCGHVSVSTHMPCEVQCERCPSAERTR